jgi:BirA family transcriptional regulator, biotin operon repressor / biotin---[acetyl-CoA-carboxylase] ligase
VVLPEVDSTMAEARARAALGDRPSGSWRTVPDRRARAAGRPWVSPRGNFHATLLMRPEGGPSEAALRSFVAALACMMRWSLLTGLPQAGAEMAQ